MVGRLLELWMSVEQSEDGAQGAGSGASRRRERRVAVTVPAAGNVAWRNVDTAPSDGARRVEELLRQVGDDGFLERLTATDPDSAPGVAGLAADVLNRRLYKPLARTAGAYAAEDLFNQFGDRATRRALEHDAARYARIEPDWRLILWLPPPTMRLKLAEMLVDHGRGIAKFVDYSAQGGEIYEAHKELWTVSVYGHRRLSDEQKRAALVRLAELMGVCWDRYVDKFGPEPDEWGTQLAAMEAFGVDKLTEEIEEFLGRLEPTQIQARSEREPDYLGRRRQLRALAKKQGFDVP
jgi:hypothetical protein